MTDLFAHADPARLAEVLTLVSGAVPAASDQELSDRLLRRLCDLTSAASGLVLRLEGPSEVVHAVHGCPALSVGHRLPASPSGGTTLATVDDTATEIVSLPLSVRDVVVGRLEVARRGGPGFTPQDRAWLEIGAARQALLVERERLIEAEVAARQAAAAATEALRAKEERFGVSEEAARALSTDRDTLAAHVHTQAGRLADVEATLRRTEAMYQAVAETIVDGLVVIDDTGRIEWANTATSTIFGYSDQELLGSNVRMLMPPAYAVQHDGYVRRYLDTGERKIIGSGREVEGRRKDGSTFPLYLAVGETVVNGERKFTGVVRNLSETKQLERQLQERQTLARIGELAAVVAHEVRNPLAAIRGVVEVIQTRFPEKSADRKVLGDLLARVDSLNRLVSDLLIYARPTPPVFERTRILELARSTAALAERDGSVVAVRFEVAGEEAEIQADAAQLSRALLNLLTNAAQAMRHDGIVRIQGTREGPRYRLTVEDEGPGMAPQVIEKCLEPFFTTKTRGTGLGLPIARRVVEEHGGTLTLTSEEGRGTRIAIDLPLDARPA